jgi:hypothetical protein
MGEDIVGVPVVFPAVLSTWYRTAHEEPARQL